LKGDYTGARSLFEESLTLCNEADERWVIGKVLLGQGLVELAEGAPEARDHILQSLNIYKKLGEKLVQTSCLIAVAGLALQEGDSQRAAQLLGVVDSALKMLDAVTEVEVKHIHTKTLASIREQLGESAFQSAFDEGSKWSLDEMVDKVLGE